MARALIATLLVLSAPAALATAPRMHRTQACERVDDGWCRAASTAGAFSVELPMPFNDFSLEEQALSTGGRGSHHVVGGMFDGRAKFTAMCIDYSEGSPSAEQVYDSFARLSGEPETISHRGHAGRRYRSSRNGLATHIQAFVGTNFQCVQIVEILAEPGVPDETVRRFLASLSFPKQARFTD